jgi:hypothetical protein
MSVHKFAWEVEIPDPETPEWEELVIAYFREEYGETPKRVMANAGYNSVTLFFDGSTGQETKDTPSQEDLAEYVLMDGYCAGNVVTGIRRVE